MLAGDPTKDHQVAVADPVQAQLQRLRSFLSSRARPREDRCSVCTWSEPTMTRSPGHVHHEMPARSRVGLAAPSTAWPPTAGSPTGPQPARRLNRRGHGSSPSAWMASPLLPAVIAGRWRDACNLGFRRLWAGLLFTTFPPAVDHLPRSRRSRLLDCGHGPNNPIPQIDRSTAGAPQARSRPAAGRHPGRRAPPWSRCPAGPGWPQLTMPVAVRWSPRIQPCLRPRHPQPRCGPLPDGRSPPR